MTDKRKNNGGHKGCGRKNLGEKVAITVRIPVDHAKWLDKQKNKTATIVALITKEMNQ